jgi:hypothetical protein
LLLKRAMTLAVIGLSHDIVGLSIHQGPRAWLHLVLILLLRDISITLLGLCYKWTLRKG